MSKFRNLYSANRWLAVTPSNTDSLPEGPPAAIIANVAGNVAVVDRNGTVMTIPIAAGVPLPIEPVRINSTNTTATGIYALYN